MTDLSAQFRDRVASAAGRGEALYIVGGDSKRELLGRRCEAAPLETTGHRGITDYQPDELLLCARAGTPLTELEAVLAEHGQLLPFEPPLFDGRATLGGTLACNLSGPARPWRGSVRDAVLGLQLVNGRGELLRFGGKVMKNVAGYDVSRLQAGALGTLGLITEVNLKVLPRAESELTLVLDMGAAKALEKMTRCGASPRPLSAACWFGDRLYLRLSGASSGVAATARHWGGERCQTPPWDQLREMSLAALAKPGPLWRLSCAANAPLDPAGLLSIDWGGAQRWYSGDSAPAVPQGAHVSLFAGGDRGGEVRGDICPVQRELTGNIKRAMDPSGIFNPGRLYSWM